MLGGKKAESKEAAAKKKYSRRDFLVTGGTVVAVDALIATTPAKAAAAASPSPPQRAKYPKSQGYLVYDSKKCAGCTTCMLSCSLTHYGVQSLSLSRIQIMQDSFGKFPNDVIMAPCRQCIDPPCVRNCPVGAAYVDEKNGNVRRIDQRNASAARPASRCVRSSRIALFGITKLKNPPSATCASILPTGMKRAALAANRPALHPARLRPSSLWLKLPTRKRPMATM